MIGRLTLPLKDKGVSLGACPWAQQANLLACSLHYSFHADCLPGNLLMSFLKSLYDLTRDMNSRSTDCKVNALTTTPSHQVEM